MKRVLVGLFAVVATSSVWMVTATPSQGSTLSASITKVGWWSQDPTAQKQPDGGFQIELTAAGPQSVAALEVTVGDAQSVNTATLTLTEGTSVISPNGAALDVCSVPTSAWGADNPGAWTNQPPNDCSRKVSLQRDPATTTWKGDVSALIQPGGAASLIILPVANPVGGLADPGFQITFTKADVTADGTTSADSSTSSGSSDFSSGSSGSSSSSGFDSTSSSSGSSGLSTSSGSSAALSFPPSSAASATAAPANPAPPSVAPPSAPSAPVAPVTPPPPISGTPGLKSAGGTHSRPWGRLLIFVPLAAGLGYGAAVARRRGLLLAT